MISLKSSVPILYTIVRPTERMVDRRFCPESTPYSPKYCPSCMRLICSPSRLRHTAIPDSRKYIPSGSSSIFMMSVPFSTTILSITLRIWSISFFPLGPSSIPKKSLMYFSSICLSDITVSSYGLQIRIIFL